MSDNRKVNEWIRKQAGYLVPEDGDPKPPAKPTANAGAGTQTPPRAKLNMNDWIRGAAGW